MPSGIGDVTDDRGEFRVYGLPAGDYLVMAAARDSVGRPPGIFAGPMDNAPTYYPGTLNAAEAQTISLGRGQETSVQFTRLTGRVATVSGRLVSSTGQPGVAMVTTLTSASGQSTISSGVSLDGAFEFKGVIPGDYRLSAQGFSRPDGAREGGSISVRVGSDDVPGLVLVTRLGTTLRGTVAFDGPRPDQRFPIEVASADGVTTPFGAAGAAGLIVAGSDGRFEVKGVFGRVFVAPQSPDWAVTTVTGAGPNAPDVIDTGGRTEINGIRITVSDTLTQVSGRVLDGRGEALTGHLVVLQRLGERLPRDLGSRTLQTDAAGRFEARGLRPGSVRRGRARRSGRGGAVLTGLPGAPERARASLFARRRRVGGAGPDADVWSAMRVRCT